MSELRHLEKIKSFGIVGATGLVGRETLSLLEEYKISIPKIRLFASERSAGETLEFGGQSLEVEVLDSNSFDGLEAAFFSASTEVSKTYIPLAVKKGCRIIDDSSFFRMHPDVPLLVPEINKDLLNNFVGQIIATPNCSTTPLALVLEPLHKALGIRRVVVSTYQSVSGAGRKAYDELAQQSIALLQGQDHDNTLFAHRMAFNCLPMIGKVLENGNSDEEEKVQSELRKILREPALKVSTSAVRVPTFFSHGSTVNIEFQNAITSVDSIRELLDNSPGVQVLDKATHQIYPTSVESTGSNLVFVGRIRKDSSVENGLNLWTISDNIRKGAALNALQILSAWYKSQPLS